MARPERNNIDYFPFLCGEGQKMYCLEETYGNDGFAVFVKILRELAKADYHYLNLAKNTTLMFLSAKCKVDVNVLESIINYLVDLEKFDSDLWTNNKIIWCQDFIDSIQDAYSKRKNKCITYDGLLLLLSSLGVRKPSKSKSKGVINTQSIVEYSIKENTIEEKRIENKFSPFSDLTYLESIKELLEKEFITVPIEEIQKEAELFVSKKMTTTDTNKSFFEYADHFYNIIKLKKDGTNKPSTVSEKHGRIDPAKGERSMQFIRPNANNKLD